MNMVIRILLGLVVLFVVVLAGGWAGLQVKARPFPAAASGVAPQTIAPRMIAPRADLPEPVRRYAQAVYGDAIPDVQSAQLIGRASLAPFGLPLPSRFQFFYEAATSSHYHHIQSTWFTLPFMQIHERNLAGHATLDLGPLGKVEDEPHTNAAAIQGYWSEVLAWVPAIALNDARLRWEAVDAQTVLVHLPGLENAAGALTLRFDPATDLLAEIETLRYQNESQAEPQRWFNRVIEWGEVDGQRVALRAETQWNDAAPWAHWEIEQVILDADVSARMAQFGGDVS